MIPYELFQKSCTVVRSVFENLCSWEIKHYYDDSRDFKNVSLFPDSHLNSLANSYRFKINAHRYIMNINNAKSEKPKHVDIESAVLHTYIIHDLR